MPDMRIVMDQRAGEFEVFAGDVKLPEPGSTVPIRGGGRATLVKAERIDAHTVRLALDVPDSFASFIDREQPHPSIVFGWADRV